MKNIYVYDPDMDLGKKDVSSEKEVLAERCANAVNGLGKISEKLEMSGKNSDKLIDKIKVISVANLFGNAIKRIHDEESISILFD